MTKGEFEQLETNLGWNLIPDAIMTYPKMRGLCMPTSMVTYDWMRIYFVSGIFNHHLGATDEMLAGVWIHLRSAQLILEAMALAEASGGADRKGCVR
jgi:hypothetical protein